MSVDELSRNLVAYRAVFEMAQHGVVLCDPGGRIQAWNGTPGTLTGRRAEEAIGKDLAWLDRKDQAPWMLDAVDRATWGEAVVHVGWRCRATGRATAVRPTARAEGRRGRAVRVRRGIWCTTAVKSANDASRGPRRCSTGLSAALPSGSPPRSPLRYTWVPVGVAVLGGAAGGDAPGRDDADLYPAEAAARLTAFSERSSIALAACAPSQVGVTRSAATTT